MLKYIMDISLVGFVIKKIGSSLFCLEGSENIVLYSIAKSRIHSIY